MTLAHGKVLLHLSGRRRRVVEAGDIYYLEAQGDETDVRCGRAVAAPNMRRSATAISPPRIDRRRNEPAAPLVALIVSLLM